LTPATLYANYETTQQQVVMMLGRPAVPEIGTFMIDATGDIGMVHAITENGRFVYLAYVQNGNWYRHSTATCRVATRVEIEAAGLAGVGCANTE
jgi:hypothetical protein